MASTDEEYTCTECNTTVGENDKFCQNCGADLSEVVEEKNIGEKKTGYLSWLLWWKIDPDSLQKEIEEYDELGIKKSARGACLILSLVFLGINIVYILVTSSSFWGILDSLMFIVFSLFIYKGYIWASIAAMLLWTINKFYMLYVLINSYPQISYLYLLIILMGWAIFMHPLYVAYRVELGKRKKSIGMKVLANDHKGSTIDYFELEKLMELKTKGIISDEEFTAKKKQILNIN